MRFPAVLGVWLAAFPPAQDPEHTLKFKYAEGDREKMNISIQMQMDLGIYAGMKSLEKKTDGLISFSLATTCKGAGGGKAEFEGEMGDLELTQDLLINGNAFKLRIKGKQVRFEDGDGEAIVDTEEGINHERADSLLAEFKSFGEKAMFTMSERGLVKGLKEDLRLKEFFGNMGGENLYPVVLPEESVKIGAEWTYLTHLKELGNMKMAGNGLELPVQYKLERVESLGDRRVAIITAKQVVSFKDLEVEGGIEGMPKGTKILIKSLTSNGSGETRFDLESGRIVTSEFQARVKGEMKFTPKGMDEMEAVVDVTLKAKVEPK